MIYSEFLTHEELEQSEKGELEYAYAKRISNKRRDDMIAVLKTPAGKRTLWRLLSEGKIFDTTFTGNSNGYFLEGKRAYALSLLSKITSADATAFIQMQQDQIKKGSKYV